LKSLSELINKGELEMKVLFYFIMATAFIVITFFGLGPVILADGSMSERMLTLLVVILLYLLLGWITIRFRKSKNN
jgi:hypothetical protein